MHAFPEKIFEYIRRHQLIRPGDRVGVAVSGGADSVALLRALLELRSNLGIVPSVVHFNHRLREPQADLDEKFVSDLAAAHKLAFSRDEGDVRKHAASHQLSIEAAARSLRYEYFKRLLAQGLNRIATAHTLDDQAETVLLRIIRGAGTRGLAGIYPRISRAGQAMIVRPLLGTSRKDLLQYLADIGQEWREDASNRDLRFARNRIRHGILPRLERNFNPSVRQALAETAEIARGDEEFWASEIDRGLPEVWRSGMLNLPRFSKFPLALRRRLLRAACQTLHLHLEFKHVEELLALCLPEGPKSAALPDGWMAVRDKDHLTIVPASRSDQASLDYEYELPIPGEVAIAQLSARFRAVVVPMTTQRGYNPEHLLDCVSVGSQLKIRNWRPGDRFWPAHTKCPKKIKELLLDRHITGVERKLWPVAVSGSGVVWVRGFAPPANLQPKHGAKKALLIQEVAQS